MIWKFLIAFIDSRMTYNDDRASWAELPNLELSTDRLAPKPVSEAGNFVDHIVVEGPLYSWAVKRGTEYVRVHHYTEQVGRLAMS